MSKESQPRDGELRRRICQLLEEATLPRRLLGPLGAGYGSGRLCVACDQLITNNQFEFQSAWVGIPLRFHLRCHVLWRLECEAESFDSPSG